MHFLEWNFPKEFFFLDLMNRNFPSTKIETAIFAPCLEMGRATTPQIKSLPFWCKNSIQDRI